MPKFSKGGTDREPDIRKPTRVSERIVDPRFISIQKSALNRFPSKHQAKVKLDSRFSHILHDENFANEARVDRYGRRLPRGHGNKNLESLYQKDKRPLHSHSVIEFPDDDEAVEKELRRLAVDYDPAREGGFLESSSDESSDDLDEQEDVTKLAFADFQDQVAPAGKISTRLAVVNLDWDNIRAVDLIAVFSSFVPVGEKIVMATIYPSEFGRERMEKERLEGPPREIFKVPSEDLQSSLGDQRCDFHEKASANTESSTPNISFSGADNGEEFDTNRLRRYQLERLRYYYAVLTCSSCACAAAIYNAVDGTEYLSTANFFDLRFIPENMDFSQDKVHDSCEKIPPNYRPNDFVTDALQHSKVKLTWDADDKERKEIQRKAFSGSKADVGENDLKAYLGETSSDEDDHEMIKVDGDDEVTQSKQHQKDAERSRIRTLLGLAESTATPYTQHPSNVGEMQVTFTPGLSDNHEETIYVNKPADEETTIEAYVRKEKDRKAKRRDRMKQANKGANIDDPRTALQTNDNATPQQSFGFDDPFFSGAHDEEVKETYRNQRGKRHNLKQKIVEDAEADTRKAELELLMFDDGQTADIKHFDIKEIERADKRARKPRSRGKISTRDYEASKAKEQDSFNLDLQDPRFEAVYLKNEFAVDPSHPRFRHTDNMKSILKETRRKRLEREFNEAKSQSNRRKKPRITLAGGADTKQLV